MAAFSFAASCSVARRSTTFVEIHSLNRIDMPWSVVVTLTLFGPPAVPSVCGSSVLK